MGGALVGVWALAAISVGPAAAAGPDGPALVRTYCFECHSGDNHRGGFALDRLVEAKPDGSNRRQWEKVWKAVRHEFMPPAHIDRPPDADRRAITHWVERHALGVDDARPDPGRVTIRRLNRMEYQYTVLDLFGVDLDLA